MKFHKNKPLTEKDDHLEHHIVEQVMQNINQGIAITDNRGRITKVNRRFIEMTGYSEEELIGTNFSKIRHFDYPKEFFKNIIRTIQTKGKWQGEVLNKDVKGKLVPEYLSIYPVKNDKGEVKHFFGIFIDLQDIKEKEKALWEAKNKFQTIVEYSPLGIIVCDNNGKIKLWNKQAERIIGYESEVVEDKSIHHFIPSFSFATHINEEIVLEQNQKEIRIQTASGKEKVLQLSFSPTYNQDKFVDGFQIIFNDITAYREAKKTINYLKNFDQNTGLYNHDYFYQYIQEYLRDFPEQKSAMLLMDLDRFHIINRKFGSRFADKILEVAGKKIKEAIGATGIVSKLKGDEFGCFIREIENEEQIISIARNIFTALYDPLIVEGQPVHITLSMGISIAPNDGDNYEQLSITSNLALSRAKQERNVFRMYEKSMHDDSNHFYYENELHRALKDYKLSVYYQPQIDLKTNEIFGVEALLRWKHPNEGYIPPNIFIPIAEESGLIVPLTEFVIHRVCKDYVDWKAKGIHIPGISINLSANQFFKEDFVQYIIDILNLYDVPKEIFHIEITESVAMDIKNSLDNFKKLKEHGIKISIDDFGTGYSSLKYLQELPIDYLKIDKSFVSKIKEGNTNMIDFIIHVANASGMKVVGEGVETIEEHEYLSTHGGAVGQGYYYSRPLSLEQLLKYFNREQLSNLV